MSLYEEILTHKKNELFPKCICLLCYERYYYFNKNKVIEKLKEEIIAVENYKFAKSNTCIIS